MTRLLPMAPAVTVRRSRGVDIDAACGQLWNAYLNAKKETRERDGVVQSGRRIEKLAPFTAGPGDLNRGRVI